MQYDRNTALLVLCACQINNRSKLVRLLLSILTSLKLNVQTIHNSCQQSRSHQRGFFLSVRVRIVSVSCPYQALIDVCFISQEEHYEGLPSPSSYILHFCGRFLADRLFQYCWTIQNHNIKRDDGEKLNDYKLKLICHTNIWMATLQESGHPLFQKYKT